MSVEQQVLWFQITIDDMFRVKVLDRQRNFCSVEFRDWVWKTLFHGLARFTAVLQSLTHL